MKSNELSKYLEKLLSDSNFRSILIDGPWGCGKTYEVQEYIKKNKKKCVYVSLFGLETIDEINTEIYKQSHKCRLKMAKMTNVLSKAISPVKYVNNVADALAFQLNDIDTTKIKKSKVVFLDDLERLSKGIEYRDLVGYINRLFMNEVRVVCLVSLKGFDNDKDRLNDFLEFREKVFDSCLSISSTAPDVFDNLFKEFVIPNCQLIYPLFGDNIRMAKNIALFYKDVNKQIDLLKIGQKRLSNYEILKVCAYTVLSVVGYNKEKPSFGEKENYSKFYYEYECQEYGENITNGLAKYFPAKQSAEDDNYLKPFTQALINYFLYREFVGFADAITVNDPKKVDILEQHPFYLSEENKAKYFEEFQKRVNESETWDDNYEKCVRAIYSDTDFELSDDTIRKLARLELKSKGKTYIDESSIAFDYFPGGVGNSEKTKHFINVYQEEYIKVVFDSIADEIEKTITAKDYGTAVDLLEKIQFQKNDKIKELLLKNSFFIPNLSGDISETEWTFCHKVAEVASRLELKEEYKTTIKNIYKESGVKNNTLKIRLWALVFYKVDNTFKQTELN